MRKSTKGAIAAVLGATAAATLAMTAGTAHLTGAGSGGSGTQGSAVSASKKTEVREEFNGGGYNDRAVAAPQPGARAGARYVTVVYGPASGLDPATRTVIGQNAAGVPGGAKDGSRFGDRLVAGDLDGDGIADAARTKLTGAGAQAIPQQHPRRADGRVGQED